MRRDVPAFGRRTTSMSRNATPSRATQLASKGPMQLRDTAVRASMNLGTARHVAPVVLILSANMTIIMLRAISEMNL